jgi:hypothetical protein
MPSPMSCTGDPNLVTCRMHLDTNRAPRRRVPDRVRDHVGKDAADKCWIDVDRRRRAWLVALLFARLHRLFRLTLDPPHQSYCSYWVRPP